MWIARNHRDRRQRIPAKEAAQAALAIIEPAKDPDAWAQARLVLADVLWDEGERGKARASVGEALAASTRGAAYANFWEARAGEIKPGRRADLVQVDRDPLRTPVAEKSRRTILATYRAGKRVYDAATPAPPDKNP